MILKLKRADGETGKAKKRRIAGKVINASHRNICMKRENTAFTVMPTLIMNGIDVAAEGYQNGGFS
jgi:hypothetical protein